MNGAAWASIALSAVLVVTLALLLKRADPPRQARHLPATIEPVPRARTDDAPAESTTQDDAIRDAVLVANLINVGIADHAWTPDLCYANGSDVWLKAPGRTLRISVEREG